MARYGRTRIKYGDTWSTIAKRTGVTASDLVKANKVAKPVAGIVIKVPQTFSPPVPKPGTPGAAVGGGQTSGKGYKKTEKGYQYQYNPTGRDHEKGDWLPTTQYNAWRKEPDQFFAYNGYNWYGAKGKPQGPAWKPGKTPLPYGGKPPTNWGKDYKYMLDPEKGTYYYWDEYEWVWKVGGKKKPGGGGGGGNPTPPQRDTGTQPTQRTYAKPDYPEAAGSGMNYGSGNNVRQPYFTGPGPSASGVYGAAPGSGNTMPSYVGLVNWRF